MPRVPDKPITTQPPTTGVAGEAPTTAPSASSSAGTAGAANPFASDGMDAPIKPKIPTYICTGQFGGKEQLQVVPEGVKPPSNGQWIAQKDVEPTLELIDNIMTGKSTMSVEDSTKPSFLDWLLPKVVSDFIGSIFSRNCPGFKENIKSDLLHLARTPMGRELLKEITDNPFPVVIRPTMGSGGVVKPDDENRARREKNSPNPSKGSASTVHLPHDLHDESMVVYRRPQEDYARQGYQRGRQGYVMPTESDEIPQPRFMILAHELVHVHRAQRGMIEAKGSFRNDGYVNQEEFETIAGHSYKFTENKLRQSFGMPSRFGHFRHKL